MKMFSQARVRYTQSTSRTKQFTIGLFGEYRRKNITDVHIMDIDHDRRFYRSEDPCKEYDESTFYKAIFIHSYDESFNREKSLSSFLKYNVKYIDCAFTNRYWWQRCRPSIKITEQSALVVLESAIWTALFRALGSHDTPLIRLLLENGADPNLCVPGMPNLLEQSIRFEEKETITLLIQHGAYFIASAKDIKWRSDEDDVEGIFYEFLDVCR